MFCKHKDGLFIEQYIFGSEITITIYNNNNDMEITDVN